LSSVVRRALAPFRRSKLLRVGWFLAKNFMAKHLSVTVGGRQSKGLQPTDAAEYAASSFEAILTHARLTRSDLRGLRLLELGPGDNLGLALCFLAAGASQAVCLDRFEIQRDRDRERQIYECLLHRLSSVEREQINPIVQLGSELRVDPERLAVVAGLGIEEAAEALDPGSFDLIVSVAVLEHVLDLDEAFAAMDDLLAPGGLLVHQIDFRDHGMFTNAGKHPLTFLTISPRLWSAMTKDYGGPNRHLVNFYRDKLEELGYESRLMVTDLLGEATSFQHVCDVHAEDVPVSSDARALIEEIRPQLNESFRQISDEDLAVAGAALVARKPA
jgi:SAM-dependent methyltransferase